MDWTVKSGCGIQEWCQVVGGEGFKVGGIHDVSWKKYILIKDYTKKKLNYTQKNKQFCFHVQIDNMLHKNLCTLHLMDKIIVS